LIDLANEAHKRATLPSIPRHRARLQMKYSENHIHHLCRYREKRMINVGTRRLQEKMKCVSGKKINIKIFQFRPMKIIKH
jgi:hypothetical protein